MMRTTRDMSDKHESHLAAVLKGRVTRGSGNQSHDQGDGKQSYRSQETVFCWDGKSTTGKSIGVTLEMWRKIVKQSHWARPLIPLRFYLDLRGDNVVDLVVCSLDDFVEMQEMANETVALREQVKALTDVWTAG